MICNVFLVTNDFIADKDIPIIGQIFYILFKVAYVPLFVLVICTAVVTWLILVPYIMYYIYLASKIISNLIKREDGIDRNYLLQIVSVALMSLITIVFLVIMVNISIEYMDKVWGF